MNREAINQYLIHDGKVYKTDDAYIIRAMRKKSVYEVIRVIDGVPLFFSEHIERLYKSANLVNIDLCLNPKQIRELMLKLMHLNDEYNSNIKLLFSEDGQHYFLYYMHTFYPSEEMFNKGIHTVLYDVVRDKPNAKINDFSLREHIKDFRLEREAFEALLVNEEEAITEGSRSNMFFVKDDLLYTAPNKKVLIGITRNKVIEYAKQLNIKVIEKDIKLKDLSSYDGVFMTSTSNDILPITTIDKMRFSSVDNEVIQKLHKAYLQGINDYVIRHKKHENKL